FLKAADIEFEQHAVAKEAAEGMGQDDVEGTIGPTGQVDHFLENWPAIIHGRGSGLGKDTGQLPSLPEAKGLALVDLVRDREIVLSLPAGRDPGVEGDPGACAILLGALHRPVSDPVQRPGTA